MYTWFAGKGKNHNDGEHAAREVSRVRTIGGKNSGTKLFTALGNSPVAAALAKRSAGKAAAQKPSPLDEIRSFHDELAGFEGRLEACEQHLSQLQDHTALLPHMHAALRDIVNAHREGSGPTA